VNILTIYLLTIHITFRALDRKSMYFGTLLSAFGNIIHDNPMLNCLHNDLCVYSLFCQTISSSLSPPPLSDSTDLWM
jgi:hypothetical protein